MDDDTDIVCAWLTGRAKTTVLKYRPIAASWIKFLRERSKGLATATGLDCAAWIGAQMSNSGVGVRLGLEQVQISRYTLLLKGRILSSLHGYMIELGFANKNPWPGALRGVKKAKGGDRRPTELIPFNRVTDLLNAPLGSTWEAKRDRALLCLLLGSGMRISEVMNLNLGDVCENGAMHLILRETKSGETRMQPLPTWVAEKVSVLVCAMRDLGVHEKSDPLFWSGMYSEDGLERIPRARWSVSCASLMFKRYCRYVGLPSSISPHSCRATVATYLLSQGMQYREVQEVLRHANTAMVERYDKRRWQLDESPAKKVEWI